MEAFSIFNWALVIIFGIPFCILLMVSAFFFWLSIITGLWDLVN